MNIWQYSRWVYLIGRSIKYKSLENSEREAFIVFVEEMLKTRPHLKQQVNIKKGSNTDWKTQNDYSLGKIIQVIGRNLKNLHLKDEEKTICDRLFFLTDKRRYMTYNEYQALDGNNVFISPDENLEEAIQNCTPYSVIILSDGNWNCDLEVAVEGTKITSDGNAVITGDLKIVANNTTIENITVKSENPVIIESNNKLSGIGIIKSNIEAGVVINAETKNIEIKDGVLGEVVFYENTENVTISGANISGKIIFNNNVENATISQNTINSEKGIIVSGEATGEIIIDGNKFNME